MHDAVLERRTSCRDFGSFFGGWPEPSLGKHRECPDLPLSAHRTLLPGSGGPADSAVRDPIKNSPRDAIVIRCRFRGNRPSTSICQVVQWLTSGAWLVREGVGDAPAYAGFALVANTCERGTSSGRRCRRLSSKPN
jgi:hypothetical protein